MQHGKPPPKLRIIRSLLEVKKRPEEANEGLGLGTKKNKQHQGAWRLSDRKGARPWKSVRQKPPRSASCSVAESHWTRLGKRQAEKITANTRGKTTTTNWTLWHHWVRSAAGHLVKITQNTLSPKCLKIKQTWRYYCWTNTSPHSTR